MRSGHYVVVDGIEYAAQIWKGKVSLFIPRSGTKPEGWEMAGGQTWGRVIDSGEVSEAYQVQTQARLDDVAVYVDSVNPTSREAVVRAIDPPYSSINDQHRPPPHPLLEAVPEPPYSVDWKGVIPWNRLTDVSETVGRIDPSTGARIRGE